METMQVYIERLEQAVRVMEGLSEADRANFDIEVIAVKTASGIRACIAGHCGLDPWFQARGLSTIVGEGEDGTGDLTIGFADFFGTNRPFFGSAYPLKLAGYQDVTVCEAIAALKRTIDAFKRVDEMQLAS